MLRRKRFWFGLAISLGFLAFFLVRTDFQEIGDAFAEANYLLAFGSIPLYFVGFWVRTIRWRYLLRPVGDVSTPRLYPVVLIGLMANNVMPARVGELVRAYLVGEREEVSKSAALGTIAVDRAFDGLTLVAILGTVTAFSGTNTGVKVVGIMTAVAFAGAVATLVVLAFSPTRARGWVLSLAHLLPGTLEEKVEGLLDSFLSGLAAIRSPVVLLKAAVASVASWMLEATMYWVVGLAFGLDVGFHVYLLIVAAANLAISVLASPGGVGPFEVTTREALVFFNVGAGAAFDYALALHTLLLAPVIIVGLYLLWATEFSFSDILGVSAPPAPTPPAVAVVTPPATE